MAKCFWELRGYDGLTKIFEERVPASCFTERQIQELLRVLTAKAGLSLEEIVGAYARRGSKLASELHSIHLGGPHAEFMCGTNPHFIARVVEQDDGK